MIVRLFDWIAEFKGRSSFFVIAAGAVAVVFALLAIAAVDNLAMLTNADRFVQDWEIASLTPPEPQDPDIVIAAINEDTLRLFPYRSPVDRQFVSELLTTIAARHPRAIGLDLFFDQPTEAAKDKLLRETLASIKVPLVVSYTEDPNIVNDQQIAYMRKFVPPRLRAFATLSEDQFDVVRKIYPGAVSKDGRYIPGFARALAGVLGVKTSAQEIPIAWRGQPSRDVKAFREFPSHLVQVLPVDWFKNKIVLIGSDVTLTDRHRTPFMTVFSGGEGVLPGITIQAYSLSQLLNGRHAPNAGFWANILLTLLWAGLGATLGSLGTRLMARVAAGFGAVALLWVGGAALFHYAGVMFGLIAPTLSLALSFWAMEALSGHEARRQREFIQGAFSRYVSPKVVERLVRDPTKMSLEGERRVMTYLFSDIADFTTMSELLESKELARLLNAYLDGITEIVLKLDGMVDKYIGDAVFAIFNAPVDLPDHAERAVRCALEVDRFAESFRIKENANGIPLGITRIGVHTGPAVIGNFGSRNRFTYTAEGDAVNVASRLEGINKYFGTHISVSEVTRALCPNIRFRPIASVVLKGKTKPVEVWEPLNEEQGRLDFIARYCEAFAKLKNGSPEALELFTSLKAEAPDDPCVDLHIGRLHHGDRGVEIVMTEK
jgi:adenylate cyclase